MFWSVCSYILHGVLIGIIIGNIYKDMQWFDWLLFDL